MGSRTTSPMRVGEVSISYNQFLQGSSCNGSLNWSITGGSPHVALSGNGQLSGFPSGNGTFIFTVQASDGVNATNAQFSLTISNALQVTTTSLPDGTNEASYSQQLQAINGVPYSGLPYSWSLSSGGLPAALNPATKGRLSGPLA